MVPIQMLFKNTYQITRGVRTKRRPTPFLTILSVYKGASMKWTFINISERKSVK